MNGPPIPPVAIDFECPRCAKRHPWQEIGFSWPDATRALTLSPEAQAAIRQGENEDVLVIQDRLFFIRGWAPVPIEGAARFGVGFWIQVSKEDFEDFKERNATDHPKYTGRLANQTFLLAPTLGTPATMEFRGQGLRPVIRLTDEHHPLAQAQRNGVTTQQASTWISEGFHRDEPEAISAPFDGTLEKQGWTVVDPEVAGKTPITFAQPPQPGVFLKLVVTFVAADENGDPVPLNAGWWVKLDDTSRPNQWSGTLRNDPRVPATLVLGTRLWFKPSQVIAVDDEKPE